MLSVYIKNSKTADDIIGGLFLLLTVTTCTYRIRLGYKNVGNLLLLLYLCLFFYFA